MEKTITALNAGYCLIRIDYTQKLHIAKHLHQAMSHPQRLYLSTPEMYSYITDVPQLKDLMPQLMAKIPIPLQ